MNGEFTGDTRKLFFWYDDKADFAEDIASVELANAKILKYDESNGIEAFRQAVVMDMAFADDFGLEI